MFSLRGAGADRGLGRYASTVASALSAHSRFDVVAVGSDGPGGEGVLQTGRAMRSAGLVRRDVYHATTPAHLPLSKRLGWVCSVQDTIQLDVEGYLRFGVRTRAQFLNSRRADVLVANSQHTAQRISHHLARDISEIPVCPLPVNPVFTQAPLELDAALDPGSAAALSAGPYVLAMADYRTRDPRKRFHWIQDLARALHGTDITLVVACRALEPRTSRFGELHLYDLDDAALVALYANALASFYPSAYEGQGLPPLEAMAAGCPVIAFRNSSVTEVVGADDFLLEDPIPWQEQSLDLGLPHLAAQEVVARLVAWAGDGPSHAKLRRLARERANRWTARDLAAVLDGAYERARDLCQS